MMKTTIEYLDAVKAKTGAPSDYALSKLLDVTRQAISKYRNNGECMNDLVCYKVASILEIEPMIVISAINAERAKSEKEKTAWKAIFERLGGIAASLTLGIMLNQSYPTEASAGAVPQSVNKPSDLYIIRNSKRKKRRFNPLEMMVSQILSLA